MSASAADDRRAFLLCFEPRGGAGCGCSFPCDALGNVDIDALGPQARDRYLFARAVVGREFMTPRVQCRSEP